MMDKMEKMKRAAGQGYRFRGHQVVEWEYINDHTCRMICPACQAQVTVNNKPLPNEVNIGGEAIALSCDEPEFDFCWECGMPKIPSGEGCNCEEE